MIAAHFPTRVLAPSSSDAFNVDNLPVELRTTSRSDSRSRVMAGEGDSMSVVCADGTETPCSKDDFNLCHDPWHSSTRVSSKLC